MFQRLNYIVYRFLSDLVSIFSRMINAFIFHGSTAQTLSSRSYLNREKSVMWRRIGNFINCIFFLQDNHIKYAWELEVKRAKYVLEILEGITEKQAQAIEDNLELSE